MHLPDEEQENLLDSLAKTTVSEASNPGIVARIQGNCRSQTFGSEGNIRQIWQKLVGEEGATVLPLRYIHYQYIQNARKAAGFVSKRRETLIQRLLSAG
jgi:hypothetical protein